MFKLLLYFLNIDFVKNVVNKNDNNYNYIGTFNLFVTYIN